MASLGVRVEGGKELRSALRSAGDGLPSLLGGANKSAAQIVVDRALPAVPVRSGALSRSLRALGSQRSGRAVAGQARVGYAGAIHWGRTTGNVGSPPGNRMGRNPIRARPFLWDAARRHESEVAEQYDEMLGDLVRIIENAGGGRVQARRGLHVIN